MNRLGPKKATHPSIGKECKVCKIPFIEGDYTRLVTKSPPSFMHGMKRVEVHWECRVNDTN